MVDNGTGVVPAEHHPGTFENRLGRRPRLVDKLVGQIGKLWECPGFPAQHGNLYSIRCIQFCRFLCRYCHPLALGCKHYHARVHQNTTILFPVLPLFPADESAVGTGIDVELIGIKAFITLSKYRSLSLKVRIGGSYLPAQGNNF